MWLDIENPPQVQYLSPLKSIFEAAGYDVTVTARNHAMTVDLLSERGIEPLIVGSPPGAAKVKKIVGLTRRATALAARVRRTGPPSFVVASSRPSAVAAWLLRIPSFQFTDYEHSDERIYRATGTYLVHPDVIDQSIFLAKGFRADRLVAFPGLKEAISFNGIDLDAVEPFAGAGPPHGIVRVLFRAPAEQTHYFVDESLSFAMELLSQLAGREDVVVVYVPRYPEQAAYLDRFSWKNKPYVLRHGVPFVSLLKSVDAVISSGGTMLREAAYLGLPAYSILRSEIGLVDRYLESLGRLTVLEPGDEVPAFQARHGELDPLPTDPSLVEDLAQSIILRARTPRRGS